MKFEPARAESHRGVGFHMTHKGYWLLDSYPPNGTAFGQYFTDEDDRILDQDPPVDPGVAIGIVSRAIDRMLAGQVLRPRRSV